MAFAPHYNTEKNPLEEISIGERIGIGFGGGRKDIQLLGITAIIYWGFQQI